MAKNWMVSEAVEVLKNGNLTDAEVRDLVKRFPSFTTTLLKDTAEILKAFDKISVRRVEKMLIEANKDEVKKEDEGPDEEVIEKPVKTKRTKKVRKPKKEEVVEEEEDDENVEEEDEEIEEKPKKRTRKARTSKKATKKKKEPEEEEDEDIDNLFDEE